MKKNSFFFLLSQAIFILPCFAQTQSASLGACGNPFNKHSVFLPMNGNQSLGQIYNNTACGLNYVHGDQLIETRSQAAGFNTNGTGLPTSITISGLPSCFVIDTAFLYYFASYQSATAPVTSVNITNPAAGNNIYNNISPAGTSGDVCWMETGTAVYRADVTTNISGNGAYNINITGFTNPNWEVDGATLLIIYKDPNATYQGTMVIDDGDQACGGFNGYATPQSHTMTGFNSCAASSLGTAFNIVADMQANVNGGQHTATLNGATATNYPNNFWCFDQTATSVTAGQSTAQFSEDGLGSDCYIFGVAGLYYQTTSCATCTPSAVSLTVTPTNSTCNAPNGFATATASGTNPPFTYSWSTGATTTSVSNLASGNYSVSVTNASGCSSVQSFTIATSVGPNVTFVSDTVKCNGGNTGSATLTATGGQAPYTYAWVTNPVQTSPTASGLAAGTYSVAVSDASGCSATYTVAVTQPLVLAATASVVVNVSCAGGNNASASATGSGGTVPYTYAWNPTGQNTQIASGLSAGTYSVVITDAHGCTTPQSVNITQPTAIALTPASTIASCGQSDGTASVSATGGMGAYTYLWLTSPIQSTQIINNLATGVYNVLVADANGCTKQITVNVPSAGPPTAAFTNNPDTVNLLDAVVYFTDLSTNASTWTWDFGDPNSPAGSSTENPMHIYGDTGVYCITLIVTDPGGVCRDTATHCIDVEAPYTFYIPNCFSPNSDYNNEVFNGKGTYIKTFQLLIFDRWGNKIFESNDINTGWDGKVQGGSSGNLVQEDVYVWKVNITDTNNKKHKYIGHVTMIK